MQEERIEQGHLARREQGQGQVLSSRKTKKRTRTTSRKKRIEQGQLSGREEENKDK